MRALTIDEMDAVAGGETVVVVGKKRNIEAGQALAAAWQAQAAMDALKSFMDSVARPFIQNEADEQRDEQQDIDASEQKFKDKVDMASSELNYTRVYGDTYGWHDTRTNKTYVDRDGDGRIDGQVFYASNGNVSIDTNADGRADKFEGRM